MEIRLLSQQELLPALHLVWEVFAQEAGGSGRVPEVYQI